jgi:hypothetical protein
MHGPINIKVTQFSLSGICSTFFGWYHHPSSGAQTTVSTASGIYHTVLWVAYATHSTLKPVPTLPRYRQVAVTVWQITAAVDRVVCAPDDGWKNHPKHAEQFPDINKLFNVASCCIYIGILLRAHNILHISRIRVKPVVFSFAL